jgi:uncharacterized membrane protein
MTQWILSVAAVYNAAWVVLLLLRPEKVLLKTPPLFGALIAGVGLVGVAFAVCAVKPRRPLLGLTILAKLGGVASFAVAVSLGYLAWSQWWMPVVNDLVWLPVLVHIWNQEVWS